MRTNQFLLSEVASQFLHADTGCVRPGDVAAHVVAIVCVRVIDDHGGLVVVHSGHCGHRDRE